MGCSASKVDPQVKDAIQQSGKIDRQIRQDKKDESRTVKILLLGAGESGKSTIIKQMRIIHSSGFQNEEKIQTRAVIYSNIIVACKVLFDIMHDSQIGFSSQAGRDGAKFLETVTGEVDADEAFRDQVVRKALQDIWRDAGVQQAVMKGHEFALNDNMQYYFQSFDRLFDPEWIPNDQDMLHARLRTTGITETFFELENMTFRMMDVGGQRSERKKWIHCFDGVQCLLFLAAMSGYDQSLIEDVNANQMHEALTLFESLINGEWFKDKPIILFLNKIDLFREKLHVSPISHHFPDFPGPENDENAAQQFFANKFRAINKNSNREIYIHFTNATDTDLLKATMKSVQDILIQKQLHKLIL